MDLTAVDALVCPVCGLEVIPPLAGETALQCVDGHSFDIARQGYVNLLTGHGTKFAHDSAEMVAARDDFLAAGHYLPLAKELAGLTAAALAATPSGPGRPLVLDAGTGTGYYLQQLLAASDADSVALDISKFALRRAARRNPATLNLVWDLWRPLPLAADSADVIVVVFAPRNAAEFARVLKPGGQLVVVTPLPEHLAEIAGPVGMLGIQPDKDAALADSLAGHFHRQDSRDVTIRLGLTPGDVRNVALMGPAAHHLDPAKLAAAVAALPPSTPVTAAFRISTFGLMPGKPISGSDPQ
ncbi:methyltransferase domain-containing protein [Specibacter sp. RAF43]|uniref:methyltransferase domain-containing protein n=1 Tax=Specibacter sp. RAF43 TaxID=3233057 RepID=UPI003F9E33E3